MKSQRSIRLLLSSVSLGTLNLLVTEHKINNNLLNSQVTIDDKKNR